MLKPNRKAVVPNVKETALFFIVYESAGLRGGYPQFIRRDAPAGRLYALLTPTHLAVGQWEPLLSAKRPVRSASCKERKGKERTFVA